MFKTDKTLLFNKKHNAAANIVTELTIETSVSKLLDNFYLFIDTF